MIVGLTQEVISEWGKRVEGVGADISVQPPNRPFLCVSSAVMPETLPTDGRCPAWTKLRRPSLTEPKIGYDLRHRLQTVNALSRGFCTARRTFSRRRSHCRRHHAQSKHLKVETFTLLNHTFTISGVGARQRSEFLFRSRPRKRSPALKPRTILCAERKDTEATREILKLREQPRAISCAV